MKDFNSNRGSRDRHGSSRRSFGDRGRSQLYDAVCAECGKDCQVPFRPSGEKPVYCSACFDKKGGGEVRKTMIGGAGLPPRSYGSRGEGRPSSFGGGDRNVAQLVDQFKALNTKLDTIINLLSSSGEKEELKVVEKKEPKKAEKKKAKAKKK